MDSKQSKAILDQVAEHGEVMRAFADGKDIEHASVACGWISCACPSFAPGKNYRVKPSPVLRPYNRAELNELVGKVLVRKSDKVRSLVSHVGSDTNLRLWLTNGGCLTPEQALESVSHLDGSPCGVQE